MKTYNERMEVILKKSKKAKAKRAAWRVSLVSVSMLAIIICASVLLPGLQNGSFGNLNGPNQNGPMPGIQGSQLTGKAPTTNYPQTLPPYTFETIHEYPFPTVVDPLPSTIPSLEEIPYVPLAIVVEGKGYLFGFYANGRWDSFQWLDPDSPVGGFVEDIKGDFIIHDAIPMVFGNGHYGFGGELSINKHPPTGVFMYQLNLHNPFPEDVHFGTYSGSVWSKYAAYGDQFICADVDGDGVEDSISWFLDWDADVPGRYEVTIQLAKVTYTISGSSPACEFADLRIFLADMNQDGEAELVLYEKKADGSSGVSVYTLGNSGYTQVLHETNSGKS